MAFSVVVAREFDGFSCACKDGFSGDGFECAQVNACVTNNGGCDQTCASTDDGVAICGCNAGFELNADGVSCDPWAEVRLYNLGLGLFLDVDTERASPEFEFLATGASFQMAATGDAPNAFTFTAEIIPGTCADGSSSNGCTDHYRLCAAESGGFRWNTLRQDAQSGSPAGWNDPACTWLVDELGGGELRLKNLWLQQTYPYVDYLNCWESYDCVFTYYEETAGNTVFAIDTDECATGASACDAHATCANTPGSYDCTCDEGFEGDGFDCAQTDACVTNNGGCAQQCTSVNQLAVCGCYPGFALAADGVACDNRGPALLYNVELGLYLDIAAYDQPPFAFEFRPTGSPVTMSGRAATSPAAKMPGCEVDCRFLSTSMNPSLSTASPAASGQAGADAVVTQITASASRVELSSRITLSSSTSTTRFWGMTVISRSRNIRSKRFRTPALWANMMVSLSVTSV